jgi:hypothetical protein
MPHKGMPWTLEADNALRNAVIAGASLPTLSKALGRSESAIRSRAYILRLSLRPISQNERLHALPRSVASKKTGLKAKGK